MYSVSYISANTTWSTGIKYYYPYTLNDTNTILITLSNSNSNSMLNATKATRAGWQLFMLSKWQTYCFNEIYVYML